MMITDPIRRYPVPVRLVAERLGVDLPTAEYLVRTGLVTTDGARVLRRGPTTGTCAVAAAKAASIALLEGREPAAVRVRLPIGTMIGVRVREAGVDDGVGRASVVKPGNDDQVDVTVGVEIVASVEPFEGEGLEFVAGEGVGRFEDGRPAVSEHVLRQMEGNLRYLMRAYGVGLRVRVDVPEGEERARETLAHRHGIEGGISLLGVKGLVDPNSEEALLRTMMYDLARVENVPCLVTGYRTLDRAVSLGLPESDVVNCHGRYDMALELVSEGVPTEDGVVRFDSVLILGMPGKLLKLAAGVYNTHARVADARWESLVARLVEVGRGDLASRAVRVAESGGTVSGFLREEVPRGVREEVFGRVCELVERRVEEDHGLRCGCALYFRGPEGEEFVVGPGWRALAPVGEG